MNSVVQKILKKGRQNENKFCDHNYMDHIKINRPITQVLFMWIGPESLYKSFCQKYSFK